MKKKEGSKKRLNYKKPKIEQVQLNVEEAVLTTCKTGGLFGPQSIPCGAGGQQRCSKNQPS